MKNGNICMYTNNFPFYNFGSLIIVVQCIIYYIWLCHSTILKWLEESRGKFKYQGNWQFVFTLLIAILITTFITTLTTMLIMDLMDYIWWRVIALLVGCLFVDSWLRQVLPGRPAIPVFAVSLDIFTCIQGISLLILIKQLTLFTLFTVFLFIFGPRFWIMSRPSPCRRSDTHQMYSS